MNDEQAFLAALAADPYDDETRLVYADWLEEQGEEKKADYLRLEHQLAGASPEHGLHVTLRTMVDDMRGWFDPT